MRQHFEELGCSQKRLSRQAAELLSNGPIAVEQVFELSALLEEAVPELNASALRQYPRLVSQRDLQSMFSQVKEQSGRLLAVSSSAAALINKSVETRGVVNEKEANRLISDCVLQIESEQSLGQETRHSIGILSPFRPEEIKQSLGPLGLDGIDAEQSHGCNSCGCFHAISYGSKCFFNF